VAAIAEAVLWAIARDRPSILNVTDADAPTTAEIGETIMAVMGRNAELIGLPDEPFPPSVGMSPWSIERPMVCATSAPTVGTYAQTVPDAVHWLIEATSHQDWRTVLPQLAAYPWELFDYEREDHILSTVQF
jgi:nucleoside-diphosphate-sugar epimerase